LREPLWLRAAQRIVNDGVAGTEGLIRSLDGRRTPK